MSNVTLLPSAVNYTQDGDSTAVNSNASLQTELSELRKATSILQDSLLQLSTSFNSSIQELKSSSQQDTSKKSNKRESRRRARSSSPSSFSDSTSYSDKDTSEDSDSTSSSSDVSEDDGPSRRRRTAKRHRSSTPIESKRRRHDSESIPSKYSVEHHRSSTPTSTRHRRIDSNNNDVSPIHVSFNMRDQDPRPYSEDKRVYTDDGSPKYSHRGDPAKTAAGIEQFKGADTKDIKTWIRRFETRTNACKSPRPRTFVLCCADTPFEKLRHYKDKHNKRLVFDSDSEKEWRRIRKAIIKRYFQPMDRLELYHEVALRKQLTGESITTFSEVLEGYSLKLKLSKDQLREYLLQNMNPKLRTRLPILKDDESYSRILSMAIYCERMLNKEHSDHEKAAARGTINVLDSNSGHSSSTLAPVIGHPQRSKQSASSKPSTFRRFPPNDPAHKGKTCTNCKKLNHIASECRGVGGGAHIAHVTKPRVSEGSLVIISDKKPLTVPVTVYSTAILFKSIPHLIAGMADSGASSTFMRRDVSERLGLTLATLHVPRRFTIGDQGTLLTTGEVDICIQFHPEVEANVTCLIAEHLPFDLIIGNDVWYITDAGIFPGRRIIQFPNNIQVNATSWDTPGTYSTAIYMADSDTPEDAACHFDDFINVPTLEEIRNPPPTSLPTVNPDLPPEQQQALWLLINRYISVYGQPTADDLKKKQEPFEISLIPGAKPVWCRNPRSVYTERDIVEETIQEFLKRNYIRRSNSPWSARTLLVYRNEKPRLCIDFRDLNALTVADVFTTSYILDILEKMGNSKFLAKEDMTKAFHQFPVAVGDIPKTAFSTDSGHYEFLVMPFGCKNAPAFFGRQMHILLAGLKDTKNFFDDICTGSDTFEEFLQVLEEKFKRLVASGIKLDPSKCFYGYQELDVLGYHVSCGNGTSIQTSKIEAIQNIATPTNASLVRSFLGAVGFFSLNIKDFSDITRPLWELTLPNTSFVWSDAHQIAFDTIKDRITHAPVIAPFNPDLPTQLHTDASNTGVGAVLMQVWPDGTIRPNGFVSRKLSGAESRYMTQEQECLAFIFGLQKFYVYLAGIEFTAFTDHQALLNLRTSNSSSGRIHRWSFICQRFRFKMVHVKGQLNVVPDALSRLPTTSSISPSLSMAPMLSPDDSEISSFLDPSVWRQAQQDDDFCSFTIRSITDGSLIDESLHLVDGILCTFDHNSGSLRIIVPRSLVPTVLNHCHSIPSAGHQGVRRTCSIIHAEFFWNGSKRDTAQFVRNCLTCQQYNGTLYQRRETLPTLPITATKFNELVSIDIAGPFRISDMGNVYTLIMQDIFTHFAAVRCIPDTSAETIAFAFIDSWVGAYGAPEKILSDNGKNLVGHVMSDIYNLLKSKKLSTSPYNPKGNPVERLNRTINSMIAKFTSESQRDWDQFMGLVVSAYNTTSHSVSGASPYSLVFKDKPRTIIDKMHLQVDADLKSLVGTRGRAALKAAYDEAIRRQCDRKSKAESSNANKSDYKPFAIGDLVWLKTIQAPTDGRKAKHTLGNSGPYNIIKVTGPLSYVVEHVRTHKQLAAHHYRLSPATGSPRFSPIASASAVSDVAPITAAKTTSKRHRLNRDLRDISKPTVTASFSASALAPAPVPVVTPLTQPRYPKRSNVRVPSRLLTPLNAECPDTVGCTRGGGMM